ncbi:DUF885 domain-containing protein [Myxococcota bacterium]|nr:DUF885 domain-containing protein [Myxococcota bacterium]
MKLLRATALTLSSLAAACATAPRPAPVATAESARADATRGITHVQLRELLAKQWEESLRRDPIGATALGDRRFDAELPDLSAEARTELELLRHGWLEEARGIDPKTLTPSEQVTLGLFVEALEGALADGVCRFDEWIVSSSSNPLSAASWLSEIHTVRTVDDGRNLVARYRKAPVLVDQMIANLRSGAADGLVASAESVRRVVSMFETELAKPVETWSLLAAARAPLDGWSSSDRDAFRADLRAAVEGVLKPALERYLAFVKAELVPKARGDDAVGIGALPSGAECYAAQIRSHTTLPLSAAELHETGKKELERINAEMRVLGKKLFGTDDLAAILAKLRTDPALYFDTPEQVEETAKRALAAARAKIPQYFGVLPKADCVVTRIPDYEAPYTTIAYYRQPVPDGSRPGQYFINVSEPKTRPRYEAEALAFHESIPGHHLQIAIAQELPELPAFRRHLHMTAFVEGWALYTETLAIEMGLYSGDLDRMGKLSFEAWRASRLVVDTGLHAMGWSRKAAIDFMLAHTALAPNNISNEVDRYIGWPGQALAYKTGELELKKLRTDAEATLGARFDVKKFHDAVLGQGAVSLELLRRQVGAWVEATKAAAP